MTCGGGQVQQALVVNPTALNVPEGGNNTFAVRLQAQPSANVTVTSTAGAGDANVTVSTGGTLTFTPSNWQTPQNVTLSAAEDADTTNGSRTITVASTGLPSVNVTATEADNDGAQALVVAPTAVSVPEGGTGSYTVRLQAQPSGNVTVTSTAGTGDTNVTVAAGANLTFTTGNWQTPQTVTLAAAQDTDTTNGTRSITVASSGLPSVTVTATEADDDPAQQQAVLLSATTLSVPEGGCASVTVRLGIQPSGNVTVTTIPGTGDGDIIVQSGASLAFTSANWSTPQTVTICAAEDADSANGTRTVTFTAPGATTGTLAVSEVDNDPIQQQSLIVVPTTVTVPEGLTAGFTVRLNTQPTGNVTVTTTAGTGDANLTVSGGASLTFTTGNWNANQTVTLAAAQDTDTINGSRSFTVASSGIPSVTVTATEGDDDVPPGQKAENPYAGATGYINPDWQAQVNAEANTRTGALANQMRNVANTPTAVWMDRIGAITAGRGLAGHLDAALAQDAANGAQPVVVTLVIYDLPNRDCAALASNGELLIANGGMTRYQNEYITPIREILGRPAYASLRLSLVIEVDSLPNLVTNLSTPKCAEANQPGGYVDGIRYAVSQLSSLSNSYLYLDIAHSGWLGWPNNFDGILQVMDRTLSTGQGGPGYDKIHGFITNSANYTPIEEIFLTNPQLQVGSGQVMSSTFYEFNPRFDERDFATDLRAQFASRGCNAPQQCGMLIDTSRNGWGGPNRPTAVSTSTDLNTYVNQSKVDRRPHRGGWCNQVGAGIGARPTSNTGIPNVDAFVWVKPPGESDGVSQAGVIDPDDPAKGFDAMCDPNAQNRYASQFGTNAMAGAPHAGRWFPAQFAMLVQNAFPPIPST